MTLMRRFMTEKKKLVPGLSRTQVLLRNLGAVGTLVSNDQSLSCEVHRDRDPSRSRSPRSRSPRSRSPRSRSKSPRGDTSEENSDSASDADSERSLDYSRGGYLTRNDILTREFERRVRYSTIVAK